MDKSVVQELWELLTPFIKEHPLKKDTVDSENVEDLIDFAVAFHVEKKLLEEIKKHPYGVFWDFLRVIPEGVPPGKECLLEDDDDEED